MYTESTSDSRFAIQDLTRAELELISEGLIILRNEKLSNNEKFKTERKTVLEIYNSIDEELRS
jgi:hypothetical protein